MGAHARTQNIWFCVWLNSSSCQYLICVKGRCRSHIPDDCLWFHVARNGKLICVNYQDKLWNVHTVPDIICKKTKNKKKGFKKSSEVF